MDATRQPLSGTERDLILTRIIDAPREKLFRARTEPALLKEWLTPRPCRLPAPKQTCVRAAPAGHMKQTTSRRCHDHPPLLVFRWPL